MAQRGTRVFIASIGRLAAKKAKKNLGEFLTAEEVREAEFEIGIPVEPPVANLFARYRTFTDAIGEAAAWWPPEKPGSRGGAARPLPLLVCWGHARNQAKRASLRKLRSALRGEKRGFRAAVKFIRGIHKTLETLTGESFHLKFVPDKGDVERMLWAQGATLTRWSGSPPPDLDKQTRKLGEIAGLVDAWSLIGGLVVIYWRPKRFFETIAPVLTSELFDPAELEEPMGAGSRLQRCLFVWGPSALLNPSVHRAWSRAAKERPAAFQEVISAVRWRTAYDEGSRPGPRGSSEKTEKAVTERNRRLGLLEAITYLGRSHRDRARSKGYVDLLVAEDLWTKVKSLVGEDISHAKAYEIIGEHLGRSASAIKKDCS